MPIYPRTRTLSDISIDAKRAFGDEAGVQLTDADIERWVNSGQVEIVTKSKILRAVAKTSSLVGVSSYDFPAASVIEIDSLHYQGTPLTPMTFVEAEEYILKTDPDRLDQGTPRVWYSYADNIFLWPAPDATIADAIVIFYTPAPASVSGAGTLLSLPDKYYNSLLSYVLFRAYEMDENFDASSLKYQELMNSLADYAEDETKVFNRTYPTITVVEDNF